MGGAGLGEARGEGEDDMVLAGSRFPSAGKSEYLGVGLGGADAEGARRVTMGSTTMGSTG